MLFIPDLLVCKVGRNRVAHDPESVCSVSVSLRTGIYIDEQCEQREPAIYERRTRFSRT